MMRMEMKWCDLGVTVLSLTWHMQRVEIDILVLFCLLLNVANFLSYLLQCALVV